MTIRAYPLVIIALMSALLTQMALLVPPMGIDHESRKLMRVVSIEIVPTLTPTPIPQRMTPQTSTPTRVSTPIPTSEPTLTRTQAIETVPTATPAVGLVALCRRFDGFSEAERTLALSQLTWQPDYPGAVVIPSCNLVEGNEPKAIVLHHTGGELSGAIHRFQMPEEASAHYIVDRDGTVYQMVPESYGAKHVNCYNQRSYCLESCPICEGEDGRLLEPYLQSVGIEIVNQGALDPKAFSGPLYEDYNMAFGYRYWEDYPETQLESVKALVEDICARWGIPLEIDHVIGHSLVNMKSDPGPALNLFWPRYGEPAREAMWP